MEFDKKHAGKKKEDTLSRKHWSLECHESLILRNEDGFFALILKGGAEEGLFPLIGDVKQKKINYHSGKVFQGELILEVNKMRVPGLTRKDVAALIRRSSEPLVIVTVKQSTCVCVCVCVCVCACVRAWPMYHCRFQYNEEYQ